MSRTPNKVTDTSEHTTEWLFEGVRLPVRLYNCSALLPEARAFFGSWPFTEGLPSSSETALSLEGPGKKGKKGYRIICPMQAKPLYEPTATCALCSLSIELAAVFCLEHPEMLCLHGAAVSLPSGTALLLGDNRSGKSTLTVRLAAAGLRIYGDDLIGMTAQGEVMSFGIPPRLRLPLPFSGASAEFVRHRRGSGDGRYQYLNPDPDFLAPFGQTSPVKHIIMLQRRSKARPQLSVADRNAGLMHLLPRYIMRPGEAETVLEQAGRLSADIPVLLFRYSNLDEAASFLCMQANSLHCDHNSTRNTTHLPVWNALPDFDGPVPPHDTCSKSLLPPKDWSTPTQLQGKSFPQTWIQAPGVRLVEQNGGLFVINADAVHSLNPQGYMVWRLLEAPLSEKEAVLLLQETFPEIPKNRIVRDTARLFRDLRQAGLVVPAKHPDGCTAPENEDMNTDSRDGSETQHCRTCEPMTLRIFSNGDKKSIP